MITATAIKLRRRSRLLEVSFDNGSSYSLPCEYLRVFSPSAEVQGHGYAEPALVPGKRDVNIGKIEPVGSYAIRLYFDDGHNSGLYSWTLLQELGSQYEANWAWYCRRLDEAGASRGPD